MFWLYCTVGGFVYDTATVMGFTAAGMMWKVQWLLWSPIQFFVCKYVMYVVLGKGRVAVLGWVVSQPVRGLEWRVKR